MTAFVLLAMLAMLLAASTYYFYRKAEENSKQTTAARREASQTNLAASQLGNENQILKHVLGTESKMRTELQSIREELSGNGDIEKVLSKFDQDMAKYGAGSRHRSLKHTALPAFVMDHANHQNPKLTEADPASTQMNGNLKEPSASRRKMIEETQGPQGLRRPDGQIVYVNKQDNVVRIDLGSADGLKREMVFSVYDSSQIGEAKARIQVTKITEMHLAEARILDVPIERGDKVYSPTFHRGQKTRFALAGFLDIDGDGKSDRPKLKSIIVMNGGEIDAELLEDGSIAGEITAETQYLIKGEAPTDKTDEGLINAWNSMLEEANRKGLEVLPLNELLERAGYHDDSRVIDTRREGPGDADTSE